MPNLYTIENNEIMIQAQPEFIDSESSTTEKNFIWKYHIKIKNKGKDAVQLLHRYWHITDGNGMTTKVEGIGVIGMQPVIEPQEEFNYTSSVNLSTTNGIMHGAYEFRTGEGEKFLSNTPIFSLDSTEQIRKPN